MLIRCRYCDRLVVRLSGSEGLLCAPCADGRRAVARAAASESRIREVLYPRGGGTEAVSPAPTVQPQRRAA